MAQGVVGMLRGRDWSRRGRHAISDVSERLDWVKAYVVVMAGDVSNFDVELFSTQVPRPGFLSCLMPILHPGSVMAVFCRTGPVRRNETTVRTIGWMSQERGVQPRRRVGRCGACSRPTARRIGTNDFRTCTFPKRQSRTREKDLLASWASHTHGATAMAIDTRLLPSAYKPPQDWPSVA